MSISKCFPCNRATPVPLGCCYGWQATNLRQSGPGSNVKEGDPENNTLQNSNSMETYLPFDKLSKLDKQDMLDTVDK